MRVLLTWELGLNLGHLSRLLPIARRLKVDGHVVLVAVRDIQGAAAVLGPAGIPFVQAPHLPHGIPLAHRATGYADILLSQGWSDLSILWGLTQGWLNLFQLFRPDKLILDYSPTVSLAARVANLDTLLVGNGFELPPLTDPLPPFPGFSWATAEKAAESEVICVAHVSGVLSAFKAPGIATLRDLTSSQKRMFATLPALDHYGAREGGDYIGPLLGSVSAPSVAWPSGPGPKIFVSVRPDTRHADEILAALATMTARVVCVASGFAKSRLESFRRPNVVFSLGLVDLEPLLDANLCITYGAEGTMMKFLLAGVPQLVLPWHVETYMAARMLRAHGFGTTLEGTPTRASVVEIIERYVNDAETRLKVQSFAASSKEVAIHKGVSHIARHVNRALDLAVLPESISGISTGMLRGNSFNDSLRPPRQSITVAR